MARATGTASVAIVATQTHIGTVTGLTSFSGGAPHPGRRQSSGVWSPGIQNGGMSTQRRADRSPQLPPEVAEAGQGWWGEVARAAAADAGGLDPNLLGDFLGRLAAPGPDHGWDRHADAAFTALGARAAERGTALQAVVDLYLSAAWRAWPQLPEVAGEDAEALRSCGQRVLRVCDDAVAALAEGYLSAGRALLRREEAARREFVDDLLTGTADPTSLLARAQAYGLGLAGAHSVLLAAAPTPFHETGPVLSKVSTALTTHLGAINALITTRGGRLVVVLPARPAPTLQAALAAVHRLLATGKGSPAEVRIALGRAYPGPSGVARSFTEARDALALAEQLQLPEPLVQAENLLVYQVLLRDRAALTDLIDTVLTPLQQARGGARALLHTLHAYLQSGGNTTATAHQLHLSVRAVSYRLARIATLTGLHPTNPAHRYTLHTAVLGARALGWPEHTDNIADGGQ